MSQIQTQITPQSAPPTSTAPTQPANPPIAPAGPAAGAPPDGEPKLFAGKFKTAEELERGYTELQRQFHSTRPQPKNDLTIAPPTIDDSADIPTLIERAGLKLDDLETVWAESGKLAPEQYAAIRKARPGLSNTDIDFIAEGLHAKAALRDQQVAGFVAEATQLVGGETQLTTLRQWAAENIDPGRLARFNKMVKADPSFYPDMVRLIAAEHSAKVGAGKAKPLIGGTSLPVAGMGARSAEEYSQLLQAMQTGDVNARARIAATSPQSIAAWSKNASS
jgi:hypothetical protein